MNYAWRSGLLTLDTADVRPVEEYVRREFAARLVAVFAEDRVAAEGGYYNYYGFERPGDPAYLTFRAPVAAEHPQFPSLAAGVPSVNWEGREIQEWVGVEAGGGAEPR